jgi:hypothetical protein
MMPWKMKIARQSEAPESKLSMSEDFVISALMQKHLAGSARPFGAGGSCKSVKKIRLEGSCESLAANIGPRNPAPPVMRMLLVTVIFVWMWIV